VDVTGVLTAGAITQLKADIVQQGLFSSRPAAGNAGTLYLSDGVLSRDNGSSWDTYGPLSKVTPPGVTSGWVYGRQSSFSSFSQWGPGFFNLQQTTGESTANKVTTYVQPTVTPSNVTITACINFSLSLDSFAGITFRDGGKLYSLMPHFYSISSVYRVRLAVETHPVEGGTSSTILSTQTLGATQKLWLRMNHTSNTLTPSLSNDGVNWTALSTQTTSAFTPSQCGFVVGVGVPATSPANLSVLHWEQS
jgi:hypothetical protein